MDLFQRYEESLTAYNRAAGLIDRGSLNEAEPLLREALASYPRQILMDDSGGADEEIRKTLDMLFENIRTKLIEIDRSRAAQRSVSGENFGSLQSIVDRNVFIRRPATVEYEESPARIALADTAQPPAKMEYASPAPPEAPAEEEIPPAKPAEAPEWESIATTFDAAPAEAAATPEPAPREWEMAEIAPEPAEEPAPVLAEEPLPSRPAAPRAEERGAKDEVEDLLRSVDSIRETDDIISEDDYRISDDVFLEGPIDEDEADGEPLEPLAEHLEEQYPLEGGGTDYTWSEEDEEIILGTDGRNRSGSFSGGLMGKVRSFFTRKESRAGEERPRSRRKRLRDSAEELDDEAPIAGEEMTPESETVATLDEEEPKGTAMEEDMESPEIETEERPVADGGEEVMPEAEMAKGGGELTPAEEILMREREKEDEGQQSGKKGFLTKARTIFSIKIGGSSPKKKSKKGSRKKKTGLFSLSVSATSLALILLLGGAALAVYSTFPVYREVTMLNRIDKAFESGEVDAGAAGYVTLAAETKNPRVLELITASAAARARAMIDRGEAAKAVGMLRLLLDQVAADENLRILLVDAYATKAVADAEGGALDSAKNIAGLLEVEMNLIHGEVPSGVRAKLSRLQGLIKEKKPSK